MSFNIDTLEISFYINLHSVRTMQRIWNYENELWKVSCGGLHQWWNAFIYQKGTLPGKSSFLLFELCSISVKCEKSTIFCCLLLVLAYWISLHGICHIEHMKNTVSLCSVENYLPFTIDYLIWKLCQIILGNEPVMHQQGKNESLRRDH